MKGFEKFLSLPVSILYYGIHQNFIAVRMLLVIFIALVKIFFAYMVYTEYLLIQIGVFLQDNCRIFPGNLNIRQATCTQQIPYNGLHFINR